MPELVGLSCRICKKEVVIDTKKMCRIPDNKGGIYAAYLFATKYRYLKFEHGVGKFIVCGLMSNICCKKCEI